MQQLWIVIGSERGFCGDFNKALFEFVQTREQQENKPLLIVGSRLHDKFQDDQHVVACINGHSVADEIHVTLLHLAEILNQLHQHLTLEKIGQISVVYHDY